MKEFTYSEARQRFATLLERARREGAVRIRRRDGQVFVLRPDVPRGSPLDVPSVGLAIARNELVSAVREGRDRAPGSARRRSRRDRGEA